MVLLLIALLPCLVFVLQFELVVENLLIVSHLLLELLLFLLNVIVDVLDVLLEYLLVLSGLLQCELKLWLANIREECHRWILKALSYLVAQLDILLQLTLLVVKLGLHLHLVLLI